MYSAYTTKENNKKQSSEKAPKDTVNSGTILVVPTDIWSGEDEKKNAILVSLFQSI